MWLPAAFLSAFVFGIGGFLFKVSSHKNYHSAIMFLGLYLAGSLVFLTTFLLEGKQIHLDAHTLLFSILIGLGSYYGNSFLVRAYDTGPACLTSPLMSTNILLVVLLSLFVYDEHITRQQCFGIGCMVAAVSLLGTKFDNALIKSKMWAVFIFLAVLFIFMREGGLKIAHEFGMNNQGVLLFGYLFSGILALMSILFKNIDPQTIHPSYKSAFLLGTTIGVFSAAGMSLLAYAIDRGPASIVVPVFSMRNFVAVVLLVIFFDERLPKIQWAAVLLLITGVLLIAH